MSDLISRLMNAAFEVLHHDGNEEGETPADTYNHAVLRKKFATILSPTPPPAPAGEREAFEAAYVKVCGYPAATIANFWEPTQQYYMDDGLQSHWLLWNARASSPAPALELTGEERASVEAARRFLAQHPFPFSDERELWNMLAIIDRCFPRLTTPADGEGGR